MKILYKILLITSLTYQVNGEMSQYCVCGQIQESEFCDRSSICQWSEKKCKIKNGEKYLDLDTNEVQCSKYSQEDCRLKDKCGFYLGECIEFKECIQFKRDECSESSQRCVSDGMKCIDVGECEDYLTWMACQNRNKENQQCFWSLTDDPQCRVSRECNELPKYLTNDFECRQQISICTVSLDGGCEESEVECRKIKFEKQCFYNKAKTQQCYWDYELSICVDLICENMRLKSDEECKSQLQECTTNGQICVLRQECGDSKVIEGCVTDVHGNKCIFVNNECKKKECELAEDVQIYSNYVKCQQFDFGLDCVYKNGGGCKNRPIDCDQYEAQEDCLSIQTQNCYWMNNQCHRQGCQSQQLLLSHNECKQVGKCMGKIGGGCQDRPSTCNMITNREFCDVDYQNRSCYWQSNQCVEYICSSFVYPEFSNHLQCQTVNNKCTYDYYLGTCLDWTCERLHQNDCQSNSSCKMSKKCKLKQCSDAPTSLIDNTQCESWLKNCTVNVYQVSNIQQLHGCIQKLSNCNDYHQQQCYSTIDGYECKWTGSVCTFKICSDYNTSSITVCRNLKVKGMKCIIDSSLTTCIQWPTTCPQFYDYSVCSLGSSDGGQCYWDGTSCIAKDCNLSSGASNNYQCTQWNKKCNFDITNSTCKERNISDTCSLTTSFTVKSHQECNSWNNSCTVNLSGSIGCRRKQYNCSNYTSQQKCTESYYGTKCEWNTSTNICDDYIVSSCNGTLDLSVSQQLCEETSISCMNVNIACELLKLNCSDYIFQLQCKINAYS